MTPDEDASVAYAAFSPRLRAVVYDGAVRMVGVAVLMVMLMLVQSVRGAGPVAAAGVLGLLVLYEPLMVSRGGATLGHRRNNLQVVDDVTGTAPTFLRALARFSFKAFLNAFNFYPRLFGVSDRALHDQLTNTSVRIRHLERAEPNDYFIARSDAALASQPSASRRLMMIIGNVVMLGLVCAIGAAFFISGDCVKYYACSGAEKRTLGLGVATWVVASVVMAVVVARQRRGPLAG